MLTDHFPILGLRVTTPRLELAIASGEELATLADLAAEGIHDPAVMPFSAEWTDQEPPAIARSVVGYHWTRLGTSTPDDWELSLAVRRDGEIVGIQAVSARRFAILREVGTGSWLGRRHQGRGIGTEMRAAVLHLAFAGLDARYATSGAYEHNVSSNRVSARLGYRPDGIERHVIRGEPATLRRLRLTRDDWAEHRTVPVEIHGLEPCLASLVG